MNPYINLRLLQDRIESEAAALNLEAISVVFMAPDDGSDLVQVVFKILPDAVKTAEEREEDGYKNTFEDIMNHMQVVDEPEVEPEVSEEQGLLDRMEEMKRKLMKGLADDDEEDLTPS